MCTNLHFISIKSRQSQPIYQTNKVYGREAYAVKTKTLRNVYDNHLYKTSGDWNIDNILRPYRFSNITVPCGHCAECLRKKQNDLAVRCFLEAKKRGSMHFVTLTYCEGTLPFTARAVMVDKETGEMFSDRKCKLLRDIDYVTLHLTPGFFNDKFETIDPSKKARYYYHYSEYVKDYLGYPFYDDRYEYGLMITPSLQRRDVQLWLKRCRVKYERKYGQKLDFGYVVCGEYGPRTCRPHYHICLCGLDSEQVNFLVSNWTLGYYKAEKVKLKNPDRKGSNGWLAASKYVAKYMSKGVFECDSVKDGYALGNRCMSSIEFGIDLNEKIISHYRCYDLFGRFDIDNLDYNSSSCSAKVSPVNDIPWSIDSLKHLHEEVKRRSVINLDGFDYRLPRNILKRLWYVKDSQGVWHSSSVQRVFTSFMAGNVLDDFIREFRQDNPFACEAEISQAVADFEVREAISREAREKIAYKAHVEFYKKSKF